MTEYERLKRARSLGATAVQYEDRKITYRSLEEMDQLLRQAEAELGLNGGRTGRIYGATDKGLG